MEYPTFPNPAITWESFPEPCYDPQKKYGKCPGDLLSIMYEERIPVKDLIWAFANCTTLPDSAKRIFAVRCVRETPLHDGRKVVDLISDQRFINALEVARKYAIGEAATTDLELSYKSAWAAAFDAGNDTDRDVCCNAVINSAKNAAMYCACFSAWQTVDNHTDPYLRILSCKAAYLEQLEIAKSLLQ